MTYDKAWVYYALFLKHVQSCCVCIVLLDEPACLQACQQQKDLDPHGQF